MKFFKGKTISLRKAIRISLILLIIMVLIFIYYFHDNNKNGHSVMGDTLSYIVPPQYQFTIYGAKDIKLIRPMSVFFDNDAQRILVANTEGHTIDVFEWQGEYLHSFGGFGSEPGKLSFPYGIAKLPNGDLLVAESGNGRVQRFSAKGEYLGALFSQPNEYDIQKPGPLLIDSLGNIYIGDLSGGKVVIIDNQGREVRTITDVPYPHGIALDDKNDKLYVASSGTGNIKVLKLDRINGPLEEFRPKYTDSLGKQSISVVRGIDVDKKGRLYVVDSLGGKVLVFDAEGEVEYSFGDSGYDDGSMLYPNGIDVDNNGRIYVADWANNRVVVWDY